MILITLLLVVVAILTAMSGVAVLSGAHKGERAQALLFFLTTIAALFWAVGVAIFLSLPTNSNVETARTSAMMMYIGAPIMCWGLMAYACHKHTLGKVFMALLAVICAVLIGMIVVNPNYLYSSIELNGVTGNTAHINQSVFYIIYGAYHLIAVGLCMIGLYHTARVAKIDRIKKANYMVLVGFSITGILALIFDLILPYFGKYDTIWVGILAMSIAWIFHYYAILRYRLLDLSSPWLKSFSRIIVMSLAAICYLVIFFIIFAALFRVPAPSLQVVLLNALMIIAVVLLFPVLNELSTFISSLASADEVDVAYIVKKMTLLVGNKVNLNELSGFLCDHLHFQYVGFVMDGKLKGSKKLKIPADAIEKISDLRKSDGGIWLEPGPTLAELLRDNDIVALAELRNTKGKVVGQMLLGKPSGKINFEDRDLVPIEMVAQVIPIVVHPDKHKIKKHIL